MNYDLIFAVIFYFLIYLFYRNNKDKFKVQGKIFYMYPTKLGLKTMDKIAKLCPRIIKWAGYVGVVLGFLGMGFIFYLLTKGIYDLLLKPDAIPVVAPVLPGVSIPGAPPLSFWHWVIAIFFVAVVHEFSHGIYSRLYNIKVKSSGFAFLGPILAAFVEPDEKQIQKAKKREQLSVYAAGPFSNVLFAFVFFGILALVIGPMVLALTDTVGITVNQVIPGLPAEQAGMVAPFVITAINGNPTTNISSFVEQTLNINPGDQVVLTTDKGEQTLIAVEAPENKSKGFIGVTAFQLKTTIKEKYQPYSFIINLKSITWIYLLVLWLFVINLGVGLFNLLPLGPVDGGRMFLVASLAVFKNKNTATKVWKYVSMFCVLLIVANLLPWIYKLIVWLLKPILFLISLI